MENSVSSLTKETNNLNDQLSFIDNKVFETIEEVRGEIKANNKECPGARIVSKLDELRIDLDKVDTRGQKLINDINQLDCRLTKMENKKYQTSDLPEEVVDFMRNLYNENEHTKKSNAKLVEKINVLEASQESMSLTIGQILERLNQQGSNKYDASEATFGLHNKQTSAGNNMILEDDKQLGHTQLNFTGAKQQTNNNIPNQLFPSGISGMGQTSEQQKMIHGFKYGAGSVTNWGNSGNGNISNPDERLKISHGIGGNTNSQLDMSINSDNLSAESFQSNVSGTNIPVNALTLFEVENFNIWWKNRETTVQCCTGLDRYGLVAGKVPGKHLAHMKGIKVINQSDEAAYKFNVKREGVRRRIKKLKENTGKDYLPSNRETIQAAMDLARANQSNNPNFQFQNNNSQSNA